MIAFAAAIAALLLGGAAPDRDPQAPARCIGADDCRACKNFTGCAHCKQEGNSCGICKKKPASRPSTKPSTRPSN